MRSLAAGRHDLEDKDCPQFDPLGREHGSSSRADVGRNVLLASTSTGTVDTASSLRACVRQSQVACSESPEETPSCEPNLATECMRRAELLNGFSPHFVDELMSKIIVKTYKKGDLIMREGRNWGLWCVIHTGSVDVAIKGRHVSRLHAGSTFGEREVLGPSRLAASTTTAVSDVDIR